MRINSLKEDRKPLLMIIPMIDIIFFLLVFFMMSMLTMVTQKTIALNLPKATIAKVDTTKTEDGRLFLEQNLVSEEELARRLVSLKTENEKLTVVLRGDEKTDFGTVVGVMDVIRRTGIERVSIATEGRR